MRGPEVALEDLAGGVAGQDVDDLDRLGALVVRQALSGEGDDLVGVDGLARLRSHDGVHGLDPLGVRDAEDGDLGNLRVGGDDALDLGAVDVLAATDDHVLDPVEDIDEALVVGAAEVAGAQPAVLGDRFRRGLGLAEVALHRLLGAEPHLTRLTRRDILPGVGVDDAHLRALDGLARGGEPLGVGFVAVRGRAERGDDATELGHAIDLRELQIRPCVEGLAQERQRHR